ncbi:MAG TPA: hypothetical protein VGN88_08050, partial [Phycisphaerae bacterium]
VHINLGNCLKDRGEQDEAVAAYRKALRMRPRDHATHSNLIYMLHFHPGYDAQAIYEESRKWDELHGRPLARLIRPHQNDPDPERPLRIGYMSPDFRRHPLASNFLPLAVHHDHGLFRIFCYSKVRKPDAVTERLRGLTDEWREVGRMAAEQIAEQVRADRIDILVDLTMHMGNNNLLVFAQKPAPVQVASLCSMGTTGLAAMDYRMSDPYSDPPGLNDAHYTEETIRLPDCYFCHEAPAEAPSVGQAPSLAAGYVTFGSLNNFCKVTPEVLEVWGRILSGLPGSRLLIRCPAGSAREKVLKRFEARGVSADRVEFCGTRLDWAAYMSLHNRIDIYLDPFPYSGHTTSFDALWMGVPLVTLAGKRDVGRSGVFILSNLGLEDLIAETEEGYVRKAIALAGDGERLAAMRSGLRDRMRGSPLMDGNRYTRHVEAAYREIWRKWCAGGRSTLERP